jgi:multidrug efflux pump subunit AcrA (membrane-fusion protein)
MTHEAPDLPEPRSALQPILAARVIQKTIKETKDNITSAQSRLESAEHQLAQEENQLSDARSLSEALQARTARLQQTQRDNLTKTAADKAKELVKAKTKRKKAFERDSEKLRKVLDDFINENLAAMLAAEEIGGPVVGELMDVDEDMLTAGFSTQGKPISSSKSISDSKRQRRIDEIWGAEGSEGQQHESEKDAAAEEVRTLLDELISSGSYVELRRDSAVARFLVRAKVAQFHPKDARRLRLIDFARELDE